MPTIGLTNHLPHQERPNPLHPTQASARTPYNSVVRKHSTELHLKIPCCVDLEQTVRHFDGGKNTERAHSTTR